MSFVCFNLFWIKNFIAKIDNFVFILPMKNTEKLPSKVEHFSRITNIDSIVMVAQLVKCNKTTIFIEYV